MAKESLGAGVPGQIYVSVTESAANTLTFGEISSPYGTLEKKGWRIQRLEIFPNSYWYTENIDSGDRARAALVTSNQITNLDLGQAALVDMVQLLTHQATAVGYRDFTQPFVRDYSNWPGGGRLVLPRPLFCAVQCVGHTQAATVEFRLTFVEVELTDQDWINLVQQTRLLA